MTGQSSRAPIYSGRKTKAGNSEALRFEQALFKSHPEFSDHVVAQVIAPGCMLVMANAPEKPPLIPEEDPVINAFLAFLAKDDMPHHLSKLEPRLLEQMNDLVGHIETDPNEDLGEDSLL